MKKLSNLLVLGLCSSLMVTNAFAGRHDREGFNFGTSFGFESGDDRNFASDISSNNSNITSDSTSVSPYLGLVVGDYFNLGITSLFNSSTVHEIEKNASFNKRIVRDRRISTKAVSIFSRLIFAETMYLEVGGGLYEQVQNIHNEYLSDHDNGSFDGNLETYTVRGVGSGYHMGGGIEIPINRGFYFTSAYLVRIYNLRNYRGNGDLGGRVGYNQQRDVSFGLAHYLD